MSAIPEKSSKKAGEKGGIIIKIINYIINNIVIVVIVGVLTILLVTHLNSVIDNLTSPSFESETFASFDDGKGNKNRLTDLCEEWGTFGDSYNYGRSVTFWSVNETSLGSNNYAMSMDVTLDKRNSTYRPYTGVFAYMTCPPHKAYDLSNYNGIGFDFGVSRLNGDIDAYIQLADLRTPQRAWHIAPIEFDRSNQNSIPNTKRYFIYFDEFNYPDWYKPEENLPLDTRNIYKVAILFTSDKEITTPSHGAFIIDNIQFGKGT